MSAPLASLPKIPFLENRPLLFKVAIGVGIAAVAGIVIWAVFFRKNVQQQVTEILKTEGAAGLQNAVVLGGQVIRNPTPDQECASLKEAFDVARGQKAYTDMARAKARARSLGCEWAAT